MASFTAVASPEGSPESCPEFDADFFAKIGKKSHFTMLKIYNSNFERQNL